VGGQWGASGRRFVCVKKHEEIVTQKNGVSCIAKAATGKARRSWARGLGRSFGVRQEKKLGQIKRTIREEVLVRTSGSERGEKRNMVDKLPQTECFMAICLNPGGSPKGPRRIEGTLSVAVLGNFKRGDFMRALRE